MNKFDVIGALVLLIVAIIVISGTPTMKVILGAVLGTLILINALTVWWVIRKGYGAKLKAIINRSK